jgi:hypothetical protein
MERRRKKPPLKYEASKELLACEEKSHSPPFESESDRMRNTKHNALARPHSIILNRVSGGESRESDWVD